MTSPRPNPVIEHEERVTTNGGVNRQAWRTSTMPTVMRAVPMIGKILYRPTRAMIWPLPIDAMNSPDHEGSNMSPEVVGETPRTTCRYTGR